MNCRDANGAQTDQHKSSNNEAPENEMALINKLRVCVDFCKIGSGNAYPASKTTPRGVMKLHPGQFLCRGCMATPSEA